MKKSRKLICASKTLVIGGHSEPWPAAPEAAAAGARAGEVKQVPDIDEIASLRSR